MSDLTVVPGTGLAEFAPPPPDSPRDMYNAELAKVQANPGQYTPQERSTFFGNTFGNSISSQEYQGALEQIYGPGASWDQKYGTLTPSSTTTATTGPDNSQKIGQYQAQLNNLPTQLNAGNQGIDQNYNTALQQLLGQRNLGQQSYDKGKQDSATSYVGAKNTIGSQAGLALNGLLRLIGSRGGGGGISDVLRQAVARNASVQRNDVGKTFGQNQQALDQNWGQYLNNYNDQVQNAGIQQRTNKEALANQIEQSKAGLNESIAGLQTNPANAQPYLNTADNILAKLSSYVAPSFSYSTTPYQAPAAASYTTTPQATPTYASQGGNDYSSPFLSTLLGKKQPVTA